MSTCIQLVSVTRGEVAGSWQYGIVAAGTTGVLGLAAYGVASDESVLRLLAVTGLPLGIFLFVVAFGVQLTGRETPRHVRFVTGGGIAAMLGYVVLVTWFYAVVDHDHALLASAESFYLTYGTASIGLAFGVVTAHHYGRQREQAHQLKAANEELRVQNQRLDEFASIISHDLRNPLAVARGYVELAAETGNVDHLDDVQACHDRIDALVEQVLALARMERDPEATRPVDVAGVATDALETVDAEGCNVVVDVDCTVAVERNDLRQVFENVFRNSNEHAGPDAEVHVTCLDDDVGFAIEDDGPGIPPADRESVFERGYSNADGTGLGLAIVAEIADTYDWDLALTDGTDGGARFEFRTGGGDEESTASTPLTAAESGDDAGGDGTDSGDSDGADDTVVERPAPR